MKHLVPFLLFISLFSFNTKAQYVTIPDAQLKNFMMGLYPSCFNASGLLDTTCSAIVNETHVAFYSDFAPVNWDGFQYFKNLQNLEFVSNVGSLPPLPATLRRLVIFGGYGYMSSLPALPNGLTYLSCNNSNTLTSLPALPNSLTYLDCGNCYRLSALPTLPNSLDTLNCAWDSLGIMPALPASLKWLDCSFNHISNPFLTLPAQLKHFDCNGNYYIPSIPALPAQLEYCNVSYNLITNIPALPTGLKFLGVSNNPIGTLPALPATLQSLGCGSNQLNTIPTLPAGLINFDCSGNSLTTLPALPTGILNFDCSQNQLTSLPTLPSALQEFFCSNNHLTSLPTLPNTITWFYCDNNQLTGLPPLPDSLYRFYCSNNQLTSLPPFGHNLAYVECQQNQLYFLPDLPATLQMLKCQQNHITCMPVLPEVPQPMYSLDIDMDDIINCVPNLPPNCDIQTWNDISFTAYYSASFPPYFPVCSAVNNVNHCDAFPLMTGQVFNDNNNNGTKDANEPYRSNIKVELSNGAFTFTNSNGYYQIPAPDTGTYTITVTPPNYYTSVPLQYNYHFATYDTLVTGDFALQATATVDSLSIGLTMINPARPGFSFPYVIAYTNGGTTTLSPNIVLDYDNTRLIYDSSSNAAVINTGNSLTLSEPGFVAGSQNNFVAYFRVNPAAVIGDSLRAYAHISGGTAVASDSAVVAIRGSYDPNDKTATPKLLPAQVINGDYIYYTIRFQNTGNDTAFSIVITDTLNGFLQPASLQVVNTSHPCKITVKGNVVYFEFINIMLPDSNVNQLKSHGYVSFRIKPQNNLVINNTIPNYAAIYFDYNSPVITNTAVTTIVDPTTVPLKLLSFTVHKGIGSTANVYWQTSNELNVNGYNIEMSTDGRNYKNIVFEKARGDQYDSYTRSISIPGNDVLYFRLKMTDIDGNYSYSQVAILKNDHVNNAFTFLNNPVKDVLSVSLLDESLRNTTATILNVQGAVVKRILLQHDVENIDTRSLSVGTYYLVTEKGSSQFVVIK